MMRTRIEANCSDCNCRISHQVLDKTEEEWHREHPRPLCFFCWRKRETSFIPLKECPVCKHPSTALLDNDMGCDLCTRDLTVEELNLLVMQLTEQVKQLEQPIPMVLYCPTCLLQHVDEGEWETRLHRRHMCVNNRLGEGCGRIWKPSNLHTVGVEELPPPPGD